ncbi:MAG: C40 family peptidase [Flavobacteriales bacterium]|nr:C40 family peptidase [Flavobacteriales bacterium]
MMEYGIAALSMIPVRSEQGDTKEMITQLLFGDHYAILEAENGWTKIKLGYDGYIGWIDTKQVTSITKFDYIDLDNKQHPVAYHLIWWMTKDNANFPIPLGSTLPFFDGMQCVVSEEKYALRTSYNEENTFDKTKITEVARMYLGAPYLWGGKSLFGIDCSGLTQMVYKICNIKISRDAKEQVLEGTKINTLDESEPGDLAFFNNEEDKITHVGIILKNKEILHASGVVKINKMDKKGIKSEDLKDYTHTLHSIRRLA